MHPAYLGDLFSLVGRVAIVTGASRGIGAALAEALARAGAQVVGVGRSAAPDAPAAFAYQACDICDPTAFEAVVAAVVAAHGRLDILINAAGVTQPDRAREAPAEAFRDTLATNLVAAYDCCLAVAPAMRATGGGAIVNVTSIGAHLGFPGNPGYGAAKGGLAAMTRALAADLAPDGIRVNNLVPGYVRTAMTEASYQDPERHEARQGRTLLGRWGEPADLAGAAIFLASNASAYVTGIDLPVDGGWLVKGL